MAVGDAVRRGPARLDADEFQAPMADSFKRAKQAAAQKGMERTSCSIWLGFSDGGGSLIARAEAENEPARPDDGEMTFL